MDLPDELREAADTVGQLLGESDVVQAYREAQARLEADPEAHALDESFQSLYQSLLARKRAGEELPQDELDEFYTLRSRAGRHPLIVQRELALRALKSYFAGVATELSILLGVDYTAVAG